MSPRFVIVGAIVTLITVIAAVAAVLSRPDTTTINIDGEYAFPTLRDGADGAKRVAVIRGASTMTLEVTDDGVWAVVERDAYPADVSRVRRLIADLAEMRLVEPKTANPERFHRLSLENPVSDGATSHGVRIEADDGTVLAETVVGRRVYAFAGGRESGTYIRRGEDDRAWLAEGAATLDADPAEWLDDTIFTLPSESIDTIRVEPPEGEAYVVSRNPDHGTGEGLPVTVTPRPEGRSTDAAAGERLFLAVASPKLEDVAAVDAVSDASGSAEIGPRIVVTMADGLELSLDLITREDESWLLGSVESPDGDATAEADGISDRLARWAFRVSDVTAKQLAPSRDSLLTPAPAAPESAAGPALGSSPPPGPIPEATPAVDP